MVTYQSFSRLTDVRITRGNGELEGGGGGGGGDAAVLARDDGEGSEGTGHAIRPGTEFCRGNTYTWMWRRVCTTDACMHE